MRTRHSEYQSSFRDHDTDIRSKIHNELFNYRQLRRDQESRHQQIEWDSDSSGSKTPPEEGDVSQDSGVSPPINGDSPLKEADDRIILNEEEKENENIEETREKEESLKKESPRSSRPTSRRTIRCNPPFVSYGWADKEVETGKKMTHNILANSKYVYPAALKKSKMMKDEKRKQESRNERCASVAASLLYKRKREEADTWVTEYQRCYSRESLRPQSAPTIASNARPSKRPGSAASQKKFPKSSRR